MVEIKVSVAGDHWLNPQEVKKQLEQAGSCPVVLDLGAEGPSLSALGILDALTEHCQRNNIDPTLVTLRAWSNPVEPVPFSRWEDRPIRLSHFFWMSRSYWQDIVPCQHHYRLAMFMGRRTFSRCAIMHYLDKTWSQQTLLSCMHTPHDLDWQQNQGYNLESPLNWIMDRPGFNLWWKQHRPISLDGHSVIDQYQLNKNTNQDILQHYSKFDIELVCETYTMGNTFFPTEKTVRPIMAGRPMLIYGPCGFLKRLRDLGFQTWSQHWSEDYDQYQGPDRWGKMQKTIEYIMSLSDWDRVYEQSSSIQLHNRRVLENLIQEYEPK